jgi:hypothetical protein
MTVTFRADAETVNGTAGTSVVVSRPSGTAVGDVLVAFLGAVGTPTITAAAGWNLIGTRDASTSIRSAAYWRVAAASDPASWTWTLSGAQRNVGYIAALEGANTADPVVASGSNGDTTAGTAWSAGTPITLIPHALGIGFAATVRTASGVATTWTTSGTERADLSANAGAGTDIAAAAASTTYTGDVDSLYGPTFTSSQSCDMGAIWAVTIRPAFIGYDGTGLASATVEAAFGADPDGDPALWTWTDVTGEVRGDPGVTIVAGRQDAAGQSSATRVTLEFNSATGDWTPENPQSRYWPNIRRRLPLRVSVPYGYGFPTERGTAFVESYTPRWDHSDAHSVVAIEATGRWDQIQGTNRPVESVLRRRILGPSPSTGTRVHAYWPAEDGSGSSLIAAATPGASPLNAGGDVQFAAESTLGGSAPLPTLGDGAVIAGSIPPYTATGFWCVAMVAKIPTPVAAVNHILTVKSTGSARTWTLTLAPGSPDTFSVRAYNSAGTEIYNDPVSMPSEALFYGRWLMFFLSVRQNGSNVDADGWFMDVATGTGTAGTLNSHTHGNAQTLHTAANAVTAGTGIGHYAAWVDAAFDPVSDLNLLSFAALQGEDDELPRLRFLRLAAEHNIQREASVESGNTQITMGPQQPGQLATRLRDCEAVDHGLIHDRGANGKLVFRTRASRYNQAPQLVLNNSLGQLSIGFEPRFDTTGIRSESTVKRDGGSSARFVGDESEGSHPDEATLNLHDDSHLYAIAGWRTNSAGVKGKRYPKLSFDLRRSPELLEAWLGMRLGDRMQAIALPQQHGPVGDIADVMLEGYTEHIDGERWTVTPVCSPAEPYLIAVVEATDDSVWRLEADGATLTAGITATQTSFQVTVAAGKPLFTTAAGDFPVDIEIGGERITISNISGASSPQTFTVSQRSVNGVVKAHAAGAAVTGWKIRPVGL